MALTPSTMMPLGTQAKDFELPDTLSGETIKLQQARGEKGLLVMFICNHCPYVVHIQQALGKLADDYTTQGLGIVAISANDVDNYPQDSPEKMTAFARSNGFHFPYLYDQSQAVAKAYAAACTPDFFLFDENLQCVYRGQFDDSRPGNNMAVTGGDLRNAIDALLAGESVDQNQKASIGCNIKWK